MGSGNSTPANAAAAMPAVPQKTEFKLGPDGKKPKPCCVCTDEKAARDKCMLFSNADDAQKDCADLVLAYKKCMGEYGFQI